MEKNNIKYQFIEETPCKESLKIIINLYSEIFKDSQKKYFINRIFQKEKLLIILAFNNKKLVGFKIGYQYDKNIFYSWIGGVLSAYRNYGIAQQLITTQHRWVKEKGYSKIRTKSMNCFKPMMILNLKNGFNIYINNLNQTKIIFEKEF